MEGKREAEGKRVMAIIAIMAMSLLLFTACSPAAKETKSETRWDDMEQQIKDVIQKEEIWDRGGFADTELFENTIVKIIPGSFSGPDRDELLDRQRRKILDFQISKRNTVKNTENKK